MRREGKLYLEFWANVLKKAIEDLYYDCYSIETIRASGVKCGQTTDPPAD